MGNMEDTLRALSEVQTCVSLREDRHKRLLTDVVKVIQSQSRAIAKLETTLGALESTYVHFQLPSRANKPKISSCPKPTTQQQNAVEGGDGTE